MNVTPAKYPFASLIATAAKLHGLDPLDLAALIKHESAFNPNAIGDSGLAIGLCQMHPDACLAVGANWQEMTIPEKNVLAGAAYLALCLKICDGDLQWALAAYNQGPTRISRGRKYMKQVLLLKATL